MYGHCVTPQEKERGKNRMSQQKKQKINMWMSFITHTRWATGNAIHLMWFIYRNRSLSSTNRSWNSLCIVGKVADAVCRLKVKPKDQSSTQCSPWTWKMYSIILGRCTLRQWHRYTYIRNTNGNVFYHFFDSRRYFKQFQSMRAMQISTKLFLPKMWTYPCIHAMLYNI